MKSPISCRGNSWVLFYASPLIPSTEEIGFQALSPLPPGEPACKVLAVAAGSALKLDQPVVTLHGVGPERATLLANLGIRSIEDLLLHRPHRYEDRRHFRPIASLSLGQSALTCGTVVAHGVKWFRKHTKSIYELILEDGSGRLHCRWWNVPYMERYFSIGDHVVLFGKLLALKPRTMDHPETEVIPAGEEELIHLNRIAPIYPLTEGLPQRWLRALIYRTLPLLPVDPADRPISTPPLPSRAEAIRWLHFPDDMEQPELARQSLALDEFVELQRQIQLRRRNLEAKATTLACAGDNHLIKPFLARLGFKLTPAQTRVLREFRKDMGAPRPMRRLLQGDVGSGKTVVAACCALMALESGYNVALMAPTEILAEQHFRTFTHWFEPLRLAVELLTGSRKTGTNSIAPARAALAVEPGRSTPAGQRTLFIGTHALIESTFTPENLGLVIIDEQHRFGVTQREQLLRKGRYPHLLVMTATPIPRTLGLALYGELDSSVIDQAPPGRGAIKTFVRAPDKLPQVWAFVRDKLQQGRQAYVIYPRVEETGEAGIKAVKQEFDILQKTVAPFRVALLHGRMSSPEKEAAMTSFRSNAAQVLLSTSLVEVGVDVPNATLMVVENAELFGLAQLHQLRGRIGRGAHQSYCILIAGKNAEANERLNVLAETTDGFKIAEADLRLRGPGEFLGQAQSGAPHFRFADLSRDYPLMLRARQIALDSPSAAR